MISRTSFAFVFSLFFTPIVYGEADIEVVEVRAKHSTLLSNQVIDRNISALELSLPSTVKPTVADWLSQSPSISLNGQGGLFQSYSIRGFSRARIRTEVDGVPIITDRRAGNSASFINAFFIERIDVQTGPSATLYGSEAMGGVINLVSKDIGAKAIGVSTQDNDNRTQIAGFYGGEDELRGFQLGLAYQHADKAKSGNDAPLNTAFEQLSGLVKYQQRTPDVVVDFSWLPSLGNNVGKSSSQYPDDRIVTYPEDNHSVMQVTLLDPNAWQVQFYHHYQNWDTDTIRVDNRQNITQYQSHTIGGNAIINVSPYTEDLRIGVDVLSRRGVDIKERELSLAGELNFAKTLVDGQQDNIALFSEKYWYVNNWQFNAGIRYDYIKQKQLTNNQTQSENQINGSISALGSFSNQQTLQLELASGFRFPTLSELFFDGETPRGTTLGNPELTPERSIGLQVNWQLPLSPVATLNASLYGYRVDDYIERYSIDEDTRSYRNLDKADIYGVEISALWHLHNNLSMTFTGQYQQGENENGDTLDDLMPPTLGWSTHYDWQDFTVNNRLDYRFEQTDIGASEIKREGYLLWQASISKLITDSIRLSLYGENLADADEFSTADEDAPPIMGRTIGLKLDWQFD
ncbi:TonB-dependent receptor plug domain-containing protein [Thalassotalea euphylliae]|uniref:TonB-dependent receptor plug domain-containing protein n=1 Tax=Thalassotalea euphylliae TaxID=1655234 RepID=UPI0036317C3B